MIAKHHFLTDIPGMERRSRNPEGRREAIRRELAAAGHLSVADLSRRVVASPATVRRDLDALASTGLLRRSHGGASAVQLRPAEQAFAVREQQSVAEKRAIAAAAVDLVKPGQMVFMNDGSTIMSAARQLVASGVEATVVTCGLNIASMLAQSEAISVILIGGAVGRSSLGTSGPMAEEMIDRLQGDLALISPDSFDTKNGLAFSSPTDAALARRMMAKAGRIIVLATAAKLQHTDRVSAAPVSEIDLLITSSLAGPALQPLRDASVPVTVVEVKDG
jgi:DeoR/GlpR family transcriptional regulator of sugar metabolism